MKFAIPLAILGCLTLAACGGVSGQGTISDSNAVVVFEVPNSSPLVMSITRQGEDIATSTDPCSPTDTSWCTRTNGATERQIEFTLERDITPYILWIENTGGSDQSGVVKIYIDGILRFTKSKTVPAGTTINAAEVS